MAMSRSRLDAVEQSGWQSRLRREVALKSLDQIHIRVGRADRDENFSRHLDQNLFNRHPFRSSIRSLYTPYTHSP
jgi:hypothetical protein